MNPDSLFSLITHPLSSTDRSLIEKAFVFAKEKHKDQKRNSGEPYFAHVLAVAENCAKLDMDTETIVGALLHDVLEDTETSEEEISEQFGENILFLVKGVTKLGHLKYHGAERHVESLRKFFIAMAEDLRVLIIKLADRLHNVQTLQHVPPEKQKRIALETIEVHAALAGRLGMEQLKDMLEDYAFPFAYPKEYETTRTIMETIVPEAKKVIASAHKKIEETLKDFSIAGTVASRIKATYSTYKKLVKYNMNTELVYDIVALRVITNSVTDCYQVLGLIHMLWKPIPKRIKDFIALPKPNGYQSLHTTVITDHGIVEVQIRTRDMHHKAELGVASHLVYKEEDASKKKLVPSTQSRFAWIDSLKDMSDLPGKPSTFLKQLHMDLFRDRIFVFTPKGDVIDLPEEGTPVDFAYAIHSDVGNAIASARINSKIAPLTTILHNGDIVEIITSKNAHPSAKWLEYAKTSLAKRHIRAYIAEHGGVLDRLLTKKA
ncbi:MAG TPA: RelA/SpoT family protein [Candidatus Paceibacterota bacterium]|nr:RelA/SpoT family protein [Candidatus Paceibacterota bacterium]